PVYTRRPNGRQNYALTKDFPVSSARPYSQIVARGFQFAPMCLWSRMPKIGAVSGHTRLQAVHSDFFELIGLFSDCVTGDRQKTKRSGNISRDLPVRLGRCAIYCVPAVP